MDITFTLCPNLIGLLGLMMLLILTRFNFYLASKKLKLFIAAAWCNIVIILLEVADFQLAQAPFQTAYLLRRFTSAACFALSPIVPMLIAYISTDKRLSGYVTAPAVLNVVISLSSILTGRLFYIDPNNAYSRGPLFPVMIAISAFYLLLLICVSFRNLRSVHSGEALFLIGIAVVMILANLLEIVFSFHFVVWNCSGVLLISYYLFLHIQYFKFDPLTGVFNRNMFNFDSGNLHRQSGLGVLSFDLNGLKRINDTQGHERGDAYIVASAKVIFQSFHKVGHVYRIGGDEFVVLMENTTQNAIQDRIGDFRQACADNGLSIACGFSYLDAAADIAQMLRDADDAMYDNKRDRTQYK